MSARTRLLQILEAALPRDLLIDNPQNAWPALARLRLDGEWVAIAIFVSTVGLSHRDRDDIERRFQNPVEKPLIIPEGRIPLLVGLWVDDYYENVETPIAVLANAYERQNRTTRWSAFVPVETLRAARETGWAEHVSASGEIIRAFLPELLTAGFAAQEWAAINAEAVRDASSLLTRSGRTEEDEEVSIRVRRATNVLVRDARFRGAVLDAFDRQCAMCGITLGLVQAAHIYPASAPGSSDSTTNGIALCANHHLAFDRCLIAINPYSLQLIFSPELQEVRSVSKPAVLFIDSTFKVLNSGRASIDTSMFLRRYEYLGSGYSWLVY